MGHTFTLTPDAARHDLLTFLERAARVNNGSVLSQAAAEGIARVAETIPNAVGEAVVQKVRAEVWGATIAHTKRVPAGAAFAADALGFLVDKNLQVHTLDNWLRLSSMSGYVLAKFLGGHDFGPDDD